MNFLNFDLKKIFVAICVLALPLVSINSQQGPRDNGWFNRPFSFLAGTTQNLFFSFSDGIRGTTTMYLNLINIKKESAKTQSEIRELKTRLAAMDELHKENERLAALLDFRAQSKMSLVAARVMAKDLILDHSTIQIDKGTHHGLKAGMAVITTEGVVGYIFRPGSFTSQVLLISDRFAVVDGIVSRSRTRGIVEGKSQGGCSLRYIEKSEDIRVGDIIVTSGIDNIFPKGFPVAKVESLESKSFSFSIKVELRPVVDPDKVEEVFIIQNAANEDLSNNVTLNQR